MVLRDASASKNDSIGQSASFVENGKNNCNICINNNNNNNLHMLQKIIPNKKMQKSCPEQQFASFGKEVILQKTHPQQKIQIVQNKEAKVNREVKVNKEAKDKDIKEAEDKLKEEMVKK